MTTGITIMCEHHLIILCDLCCIIVQFSFIKCNVSCNGWLGADVAPFSHLEGKTICEFTYTPPWALCKWSSVSEKPSGWWWYWVSDKNGRNIWFGHLGKLETDQGMEIHVIHRLFLLSPLPASHSMYSISILMMPIPFPLCLLTRAKMLRG